MISKIPKSAGNKDISRVMKGNSFVWQKTINEEGTQTVSWILTNNISAHSKSIIVLEKYQEILKQRQIISIKLDGIGEIKSGIKNEIPFLGFNATFYELFGIEDWVPTGTKITVTYK